MNEEQNQMQEFKAPMAELGSPLQLLDKSIRLYKAGFKKIIGMILVPLLGLLPLLGILLLFAFFNYLLKDNKTAQSAVNVIMGLAGLISFIFWLIVTVIAQAGLYLIIKNISENPTVKQTFFEAKKIAWKFFVVGLATAIFTMLWGLLFIIPGIWAAINYSFALWVFLHEEIKGTAALKRSKELVKGFWWKIFGRLILIQIILVAIIIIPGVIIASITDNELVNNTWNFISNIISFLLGPLTVIYTYFIYKDIKSVKGETVAVNE